MVAYINDCQKAQILVMLHAKERPAAIARATEVSERQVWRYKRMFDLMGDPFPPTKTPQNACLLQPWAMEKVLDLLRDKPQLYLDEIQQFLLEDCYIFVYTSTISRRLGEARWKKKRVQYKAA